MKKLATITLATLLLSPFAELNAAEPFPGAKTDYHGVALYSVPAGNGVAKVLCPENPLPGKPWVLALQLYDLTNPPVANMGRTQLELVKRGFHVVAFGLKATYGEPEELKKWDAVYQEMNGRYGLGKMALMGLSREGLYIAHWAALNPGKVSCLYMDKAVCDFKSWPGGKLGISKGSPDIWKDLLAAYHFGSEAEALAYDQNPVDLAPKLAADKVAIIYVMGEQDPIVPYAENGARIEEQYKKLGGTFKLIRRADSHHPHGLEDPTPIVDFIQDPALQTVPAATQANTAGKTKAQPSDNAQIKDDGRMAWWLESKFGLFIHFGPYAVIAKGGEWIMHQKKIPLAQYKEYARQFTLSKYDPELWVKSAKAAGMKYIVITAKHHDGFALFDTKASDWNAVQATPYGKDILKPLAEACRKEGIKLGFYYSQAQDWCNGGAVMNNRNWDPAQSRDMDGYLDKIAIPQIRELLTNYGKDIPAVLWWDTPCDMNKERAQRILDEVNKLRPDIFMNNRLGGGFYGSFETPEQEIPVVGKKGNWETCMTMNGHWGYDSEDKNWKSTTELIRKLAEVCSKGGNFLLNVGPTAEGEIPQPSMERLQAIGQWMKINGESIYGTTAGPLGHQFWGCATRKGDLLYLHVFNWPKDGKLGVSLLSKATGAYLLSSPDKKLEITQEKERIVIHVPETAPDESDSVVVLKMEGEPKFMPLPTIGAIATASSFQKGCEPQNALDYNTTTPWKAPTDVTNAVLEIDLGQAQEIAGYGFDEPRGNSRLKQEFRLEALVGETWQKVAEGKTENIHGSVGAFSPVTASKFRISMSFSEGAPGILKLQLYRPD